MAIPTPTIRRTTTTCAWFEADSGTGGPVRLRDLYAAYIACRRGKRQARNTMAYEASCLDRLIETRDALNDRTWRPSRTLAFVVDQPKAREIHAADFGDRVVHHWLVPRLEAWFEPVFIHDSYSNRKGKGTHAAVDRLQGFVRQATRNGKVKAHYLQLDIANFFNSIDREILYGWIRHRAERVWKAEKLIAGKPAPTGGGDGVAVSDGFVGGASAPIDAPIAGKPAPTGGGDGVAGGNGFVGGGLPPIGATTIIAGKPAPTGGVVSVGGGLPPIFASPPFPPISQPNRIPMGILPDGTGQAGTHGVGDDIARDMLQIFPIAQGMVMEARLPDCDTGCAAAPVDSAAAQGFVASEQVGERGVSQLQQPMQVVGHQHEGECAAQSRFVASAQFPYSQSGQVEIGEQGQTVLCHRGDNIAAPDFRDAANAQVAAMGMCCHGGNHARDTEIVGGGSPPIRPEQTIAGKPAPTGDGFVGGASAPIGASIAGEPAPTGDGFVGGALAPINARQIERHAEINFCLWLCRTLLDHDAGAHAVERGPARSFATMPACKRLKNAPSGVGLPIGNLTSQFFANVYLDRLDQFVKHNLKCRHYLRYVDDFVLVHEDPAQLLAWRDAIETFLAESLALRFKELSEPMPVGSGIDFLGYVVRRTYRLPRRRVLRQAQARLAGFAAEVVRPVVADGIAGKPAPTRDGFVGGASAPIGMSIAGKHAPTRGDGDGFVGGTSAPISGWVIRWTPDVRERLRASWASTLGHLSQAASRRQALALWQRHSWARSAFAYAAGRFRLINRFEPISVASYTGQKRWFARRFPDCAVLVQKGWEYELVGASGHIAGKPAPTGGFCVGGASAPMCSDRIAAKPAPTIPASHLPRIVAALRRAGRAYVIVREEGYLKRGLKRRVLSEVGWPATGQVAGKPAPAKEGVVGGASAPMDASIAGKPAPTKMSHISR